LGRLTGVPHVKVGDQQPSALEDREQCDWSVRADQLDGGVYLYHRQTPSSCRDGIAFTGVRLFPHPQLGQFLLPGGPVNHYRQRSRSEVGRELVLITWVHRCFLLSLPLACGMTPGEQRPSCHGTRSLFYWQSKKKASRILRFFPREDVRSPLPNTLSQS